MTNALTGPCVSRSKTRRVAPRPSGYAEAHYNWSAAMRAMGHKDEADTHYQEALRLNPVLSAVRK